MASLGVKKCQYQSWCQRSVGASFGVREMLMLVLVFWCQFWCYRSVDASLGVRVVLVPVLVSRETLMSVMVLEKC